MSESERTVSASTYESALRQLNVAQDGRRNLDRQLRVASDRNQKLVEALAKTKAEIERLRLSLSQEVTPPLNSALVLSVFTGQMTYQDLAEGKTPAEADPYVDILLSGRLVRVGVSALIQLSDLAPGMTVLIDENTQIVAILGYLEYGDVVTIREVLDPTRVVVDLPNQSKSVVRVAGALEPQELGVGDSVTYDSKAGMIIGRVPSTEAADLVLEEVPDTTYAQIGGLSQQIDQIRDAVELPFLHPEIFRQYYLSPPKGILLYGPPGNGKTLIAKAVANSLAARAAALYPGEHRTGYFLNIKGPELLDKYVGETERQIREIFAAARDKAEAGHPVVVFFDEMESLFRTRGSGKSSDVETTIVPQLLSEIDGVESLDNVIVIGATNREDMIDPAVLRPGRLDIKIRINRPDQIGTREIFKLYLTQELPIHASEIEAAGSKALAIEAMVDSALNHLFAEVPENRYVRVSFDNGQSSWLYRGQFLSGAVVRNIVDAAKKLAVKAHLGTQEIGLTTAQLIEAVRAEFEDHIEVPQLSEVEDVLVSFGVRRPVVAVDPA